MDYWEGFLLGPLWSDSDYETRRHNGQILGIGLVVWVAIAAIILMPGAQNIAISDASLRFCIVVYAALFFVSPFLSRFYYPCVFPVKIAILLVQLGKLAAGMMVPVNILLKGFTLDFAALQDEAMVFFNEYLGGMIDRFTGTYNGLGMIIGIVAGGLSIFLMGTGIALAALITPRLLLAGMRILQWVYDSVVFRLIFRRVGLS